MVGSNHAEEPYCCHVIVAMYLKPVHCALNLQVITKLHSILKPFLLRRVKSDVENSLPGKKELILYADMTQQQRDFNEELRQNTLNVRC
jgi:SNF2 family DNA or RNA helicase